MTLNLKQKLGAALAVVLALGLGATTVRAESIERLNVEAELTSNRTLSLQETIDYNFGTSPRHGILRTLPERYERSLLRYDLHYKVRDVTMDGAPVMWEQEKQGADLVLRVGDQNVIVTGTHRYVIRYQTDRAINDFTDTHELYWNVTGNEWPVPIRQSSFRFTGPAVLRQQCFTGSTGSTESLCSFRKDLNTGALVVDAPAQLDPHEGLTVVLEFPKDALASESILTKFWYLLTDNLFSLFPILLCFGMVWIWYTWGRDPRGRGVIIPQYEPPERLTPGLMAGLVEQEVSTKAMSATILDLARRGYTKLELVGKDPENPTQILYTRLAAPSKDTLAPYESELLEALFAGQTEINLKTPASEARWTAYQKVLKTLADDMLVRGWFLKNPVTVRAGWLVLAFAVAVFAFFLESPLYLVLAAVVAVFGWQMPRVTKLGAEMLERILGFKRFLMVTEKDRLAFSDAPAKRPEQFAEFLPAAVALGVEKQWAKQFEGMLVQPPSYIHGAGANWTSLMYAHAFTQVSHSVATSMTRQTQAGSGGSGFSGGGGSSGGGFGGGGGGSW